MNARLAVPVLLSVCLAGLAPAAEPAESAPKKPMRDMIKARMIEDAKKQPATPAPAAKPASAATAPAVAPTPPAPASAAKDSPKAPEPATILPKVEVRRDRITELDRQLALQEKEIAREKVNTQATEVDKALNDSRVAKALAIFGGESASHREGIAKERVSLMEDEKSLIEAIARAKTKEEKQELQKELDALRAVRRELEKALR